MSIELTKSSAAGQIRANRLEISSALAKLVADWPKYAEQYAADPLGFAELEVAVLVDYMSGLIETCDENYRHLYVGEKVKQLYDPTVDQYESRRRIQEICIGERKIFLDSLNGNIEAQNLICTHFDAIEHLLVSDATTEMNLLLVGDCLYLDLMSFLTAPALEDGVRIRPTFVTTHSAIELRAQLSQLADRRFDLIAFSPFTYAMLDDYGSLQRPRGLFSPKQLWGHIKAATREAMATFEVLADLFDCPIVLHLPAPIVRHGEGLRERVRAALIRPALGLACRELNKAFRTRASERNAAGQVVYLLNEADAAKPGGLWSAGRWLYRSKLQHPAAFGAMLASPYRDLVMVAARLLRRKLVVCDLDNTLWQGVIGEGLGIEHHYDRQEPLLALKKRGVILAINSKNDPAKATWVAKEHCLSIEDFVSKQINWDPKPVNMRRIAEHLNLKTKDFIFIDDRADERAIVEQQFPELLALDAVDVRSWRLLKIWSELLPQKPNADRTDFYRQRDERQKFIESESVISSQQQSDMLKQLKLRMIVREPEESDFDRIADLINRTNQFNMTGSRISMRQVRELAKNKDCLILIGDAADRFGEMGTVSVVAAVRIDGKIRIPYFVLSCRVFGYSMEFAMLEEVRKFCQDQESILGNFVETAFNQPCRNVYSLAGFSLTDDGWQLLDAGKNPIQQADWLTVDRIVKEIP